MKKIAMLLVLIAGMSFAVTAGDFPCISGTAEHDECCVKFKDPRDGQVYLARKQCRDNGECYILLAENSRYKSPNAICDQSKEHYYYGCEYPEDEAPKEACPDLENMEKKGCSFVEDAFGPIHFVGNKNFAKLRNDVLSGKNFPMGDVVVVKDDSSHTATPCSTAHGWRRDLKTGRWGVGGCGISRVNYWRCYYKMSE